MLARINRAGFLQAGSALKSYLCTTESTSPVVCTGDIKKIVIVTFWLQYFSVIMEKLAQCEAALASQQVGFSALWLACNVCVCGLAQEEQSIFGVCLLIYINRLFSFP